MNDEACSRLKRADTDLSRVFQHILSTHAADLDFVKAFREAQNAWILFRDAHVNAIYPDPDPRAYGSVYPMCRCVVLEQVTTQRAKELRRLWVDGVDEGDVCVGSCVVKAAKSARKRK